MVVLVFSVNVRKSLASAPPTVPHRLGAEVFARQARLFGSTSGAPTCTLSSPPPDVPPLDVVPVGLPDVPDPDVEGLPDDSPEVDGLPEELETPVPAEPVSRTSWVSAPEHPGAERHTHATTKEVRKRRVMGALRILAHAGDPATFVAGPDADAGRAPVTIAPVTQRRYSPRRPPWV